MVSSSLFTRWDAILASRPANFAPEAVKLSSLPSDVLRKIIEFCAVDDEHIRTAQAGGMCYSISSLCLVSRRIHDLARPFQLRVLRLSCIGQAGMRAIRHCRENVTREDVKQHIRELDVSDRQAPQSHQHEIISFEEEARRKIPTLVCYALECLRTIETLKVELRSGEVGKEMLESLLTGLMRTQSNLKQISITNFHYGIALAGLEVALMRHNRSLERFSIRHNAMGHSRRLLHRPGAGIGRVESIEMPVPLELAFVFGLPRLQYLETDFAFFKEVRSTPFVSTSLRQLSLIDVDFQWIAETLLPSLASPLASLSLRYTFQSRFRRNLAKATVGVGRRIDRTPPIVRLNVTYANIDTEHSPIDLLHAFERAEIRTLYLSMRIAGSQDQQIKVFRDLAEAMCEGALLPHLTRWEHFQASLPEPDMSSGRFHIGPRPAQDAGVQLTSTTLPVEEAKEALRTRRGVILVLREEERNVI